MCHVQNKIHVVQIVNTEELQQYILQKHGLCQECINKYPA